MCFTVNVNLVKEELENRYGATLIDHDKYRPSYYYHAFALPELPAVCSGNRSEIKLLNWGLIPSWVKSGREAEEIRMKTFNARSETIEQKNSFSESFKSKRCLIPVRGFYEWQHVGSKKIPWYIYHSGNDILSLAGLYDEWFDDKKGEVTKSFTILTTDSNEMMSEIHNSAKRMPVVLDRSSESLWINPASTAEITAGLLKACPSDFLKAYTISPLINNKKAEKNTPEIIREYFYPSQSLLF